MTICLTFLLSGVASAEESKGVAVSGDVKLGVRYVEDHNDSAKFLEYRDLDDGAFGSVKLKADFGPYFMNLTGKNVGQDDQYYRLNGGKYGYFKYSLYYNEIIHNLSFGARTFYSGVGHSTLDYNATNRAPNTDAVFTPNISTNTNLWNEFDYSIQRKDVGGSVDITLNSPFYVFVEANQLETKGVTPLGAPSGVFADRVGAQTSSFGNVTEMPAPVDWTTKNLGIEAGYNSKKFLFSIGWLMSKFENDNDYLTWRNPYVTTTAVYEVNSLAADNEYYKLSAQGVIKQLPLDSVFAVKLGYSKLKNDLDLLNTIANATSGGAATSPTYTTSTLGLSSSKFEGDIKYKTASVALTTHPIKPLDMKIYYNYLRKDNDSDEITFTAPDGTGTSTNELFGYKKNNFGADVTYKLSTKTKAMVGYEYIKVRRDAERDDAETTTDHSAYVELKNNSLHFLTAKIRYQHLWRSSDFENETAGTGVADANYIRRFLRLFDATDKDMDALKIGLDITPFEHFDVGLEYIYKKNDYDETVIGRTSDTRHEYFVDVAYALPGRFKVSGFFDYETVKYDSYHRNFTTSADVNAAATSSNYNWDAELKDKNFAYGIGVEVPVAKKIDLVTSWMYEKANGKADFESQNNYGTPIDITEYDDYKKSAFNTKVIYKVVKNLDVAFGYAYERLKYDDDQWNGYQNVVYSTSAPIQPNTFLTGAYQDNHYSANIVYLAAKYKF